MINMDIKELRKKYVHEYVLIELNNGVKIMGYNNGVKIRGYIEDYNKPLDMFMVFVMENHEYLFISRKLIKSIEVIKDGS
jgi:sRNA-binding regulator protein Hfq